VYSGPFSSGSVAASTSDKLPILCMKISGYPDTPTVAQTWKRRRPRRGRERAITGSTSLGAASVWRRDVSCCSYLHAPSTRWSKARTVSARKALA
jgi:hypothetical protein